MCTKQISFIRVESPNRSVKKWDETVKVNLVKDVAMSDWSLTQMNREWNEHIHGDRVSGHGSRTNSSALEAWQLL